MKIDTGHVNWDDPIVWVNPLITEDDNGLMTYKCRVVSRNLKSGNNGEVGFGVIVDNCNGTESMFVTDDKGWSDSTCKRKDGTTLKIRFVFNYTEEVPTSEKLGEF